MTGGGEVVGHVTVGQEGQDGLGHLQLLGCSGSSMSSSKSLILGFLLKIEADLPWRDLLFISLFLFCLLQYIQAIVIVSNMPARKPSRKEPPSSLWYQDQLKTPTLVVFLLFLLTEPKMLVLHDRSRSRGHTRGTLESCLQAWVELPPPMVVTVGVSTAL